MSTPSHEQMIADSRRRFTRWPGWLRLLRFASAPQPGWMESRDPLFKVWEEQRLLVQRGRVVWGALVQANSQLFQWGDMDCPAQLVYSPEPSFDAAPQRLRAVGQAIFDLKHTRPDSPELQVLADSVTQELERSFGLLLPASLGATEDMATSSFMVYRQHLPDGFLRGGVFPILTAPGTRSVMILPYAYWGPDMLQLWMQRSLGRA
ncbi:hypothetical protein [Leeia sp.]|uniref:hypothetical protein n=1 Tax=Leeia sp. TaxID=2884678 RepID=UPI0035B1DEBA